MFEAGKDAWPWRTLAAIVNCPASTARFISQPLAPRVGRDSTID
jgi:hypothetical protein